METTSADWEINIDDISIISEIDSSSNSVVFLCMWRRHQPVVMKVIRGNAEQELCVVSKCLHPKVCQFLGACVRQDKTFMIFEYMPGGNLKTFMATNPSTADRLQIALDISIGLDYLSNRKPMRIIHRDIKPENILIGDSKNAKICDFGISKLSESVTGSPRPHTGEVGTARWTAPEVLLSQSYNETSDVYAYGMVLKYLWSGVLPYNEYTMSFQAAFAKVNGIPDDLSMIDNDTVRDIVERCTDFDTTKRPSHSQIARTLKMLIDEQAIS